MNKYKFKKKTLSLMIAQSIILTSLSVPIYSFAEESQSSDEDENVIVITGIRASQIKSLEMKKESTNVIDSIVAEDIGKLPDMNIAEALQRVPGVTVNRVNGEGRSISVRGMAPEFNITTLNGRKLATENIGRDFSYDILASELVSEITVNKSSQASLTDGGIGAIVDIVTRKPLSLDDFVLHASAEAIRDDLSGDTNPRASLLISNKYSEDFGILFSANYSGRALRQDKVTINNYSRDFTLHNGTIPEYGNGGATLDQSGLIGPSWTNFLAVNEDRTRTGGTLVLQWKPSDDVEITWDNLVSEYEIDNEEFIYYANPTITQFWGHGVLNSATIDSNGFVTGVDMGPGRVAGLQTARNPRKSTTTLSGLNFKWSITDEWALETDLAVSESKRENTAGTAKFDMKFVPESFSYAWDTGNTIPDIVIGNPLPSQFNDFSYYGDWADLGGEEVQDDVTDFKMIANWAPVKEGLIDSIKFGVSYISSSKNTDVTQSADPAAFTLGRFAHAWNPDDSPFMYANISPDTYGWALGVGVPNEFLSSTNINNYFGQESGNFPRNWTRVDIDAWQAYLQELSPFAYDLLSPVARPERSYEIEENVTAGFIEANLSGNLNDMEYKLNLGLRIVETQQISKGNRGEIEYLGTENGGALQHIVYSGLYTPLSVTQTFTNVLPSLNYILDIDDQMRVRASAAKVMSRAPLNDLRVAQDRSVTWNNTVIETGNPQLDPFEANQYDLTFEWYYSKDSAFAANLFYKDINTFIATTAGEPVVENLEVRCPCWTGDGPGVWNSIYDADISWNVTQPINDDEGGSIKGLELAWNHNFDEIIEGLGLAANYTYLDSETTQEDRNGNKLPFIGTSDTSYNLIAYYETNVLGVRLAYNWREQYLSALATGDTLGDELYTENVGWLDLSMYYQVSEDVVVTAFAGNLLDSDFTQTFGPEKYLRSVEYTGRQLGLGVRVKF